MNIGTAVERLETIPPEKLRHLRGLVEADLDSYKHCARNYPPDRWEKYAVPFIAEREDWLRRIDARMAACGIPPYDINQLAQGMKHLKGRGGHAAAHTAPDRAS